MNFGIIQRWNRDKLSIKKRQIKRYDDRKIDKHKPEQRGGAKERKISSLIYEE